METVRGPAVHALLGPSAGGRTRAHGRAAHTHLSLAVRSPAGGHLAAAGRHRALQRGGGPAALRCRRNPAGGRQRALRGAAEAGAARDRLARDSAELGGAALVRAPSRVLQRPARSEEHTSELQSLMRNSYAVFCLKKKKNKKNDKS